MYRKMLAFAAVLALAACGNFRDTFVAKGKVAARAGELTLTPERLADILSGPRGLRVSKEAAAFVTGLWVDYALFAQAAAEGKLPRDSVSAVQALWPELAELRTTHWHDSIVARRPQPAAAAVDSVYHGDDVRVFQHILFGTAANAKRETKAAARKKAEATLSRIRGGADFGQLASELSDDPGSKRDQGFLPPGPRGQFVPQFDSAGWALAPGAMSGVVETQFGYHIIRRPDAAAVRERLTSFVDRRGTQKGDSAYMDDLARSSALEVAKNAGADMKAAAENPEASRNSKKRLTSFKGGGLTVAEYLRWVRALPPPYAAQLRTANDSMLRQFARVLSLNLLLLRQADSAKVGVTPEEWQGLYARYTGALDSLRADMGFTAADTGLGSPAVADKVTGYFDRLVAGEVRMRPIPSALGSVLRARAEYRIDAVGVTRAFELAQARLAKSDSAGAAAPPTGMQPAPGPAPVPAPAPAPAESAQAGAGSAR
ncbi:MAG TPA: peptidylprolyl isomerase [Gemmatimonadales bacterium]|nr:peptidylprolyl isomerase [Gemmatimonadales bacterium]